MSGLDIHWCGKVVVKFCNQAVREGEFVHPLTFMCEIKKKIWLKFRLDLFLPMYIYSNTSFHTYSLSKIKSFEFRFQQYMVLMYCSRWVQFNKLPSTHFSQRIWRHVGKGIIAKLLKSTNFCFQLLTISLQRKALIQLQTDFF